ncbi:integrase catalytic domain-containing protein [Trichonephila clavipes]|nr:integrase catalytic domain-containing protein [Trichonephila clavipes]
MEALVDINRFSSLKKLLKTTAWVFRFVNNARNIYKSMDFYITADEIQNAEYFWLKCVQSEFYSAEILALKQNEQLRSSSEIKSLVPYLDENNLLRLTGRLLEADLCFGEKHPVILPRRCKFTELLVIREHERIGHCGVSATLTQLRKKYWVPKGRQLVKTMILICLVCKKYSAKPADQLSGQLPRDRITQSPPFQVVGIDFTGAILVKDNQGTRKSYVSLFTCAVTRAVHLELVSDMSTKSFLLALRRFLARRGNCKVIYSDNARTFKAAERELAYFANILKDSEFQNFVADKGINWKFIVEHAPWWGGFYERLVKTIKDPLRKILGRALLTFEELSTILSEVEVIVNHRPLTYVENVPGEPEPLTPAHFLELGYGDSKYPIHFIEMIDATTAKESYKKRKTYQTLLLKQLWRRWKEQYLLQLKTANHFKTPSVHKNLKLNDVVLVEGNVKSKLLWELGIIKEIFIGRDDNVRSCLIKPFKGLFKKPIQLLYPLEIVLIVVRYLLGEHSVYRWGVCRNIDHARALKAFLLSVTAIMDFTTIISSPDGIVVKCIDYCAVGAGFENPKKHGSNCVKWDTQNKYSLCRKTSREVSGREKEAGGPLTPPSRESPSKLGRDRAKTYYHRHGVQSCV